MIPEHFDSRSNNYEKHGLWVRDNTVMSTTIDFLDISTGSRILDVGAGTGAVLKSVCDLNLNLQKCVALDISPKMLSEISTPNIEICCHDAHNIPYDNNSFDSVLCRQALHYIDDLNKIFAEIIRVVDNGGFFIVGQITPFSIKNEYWWKKILKVRQPLRKHFLTLNDILSLFSCHKFIIDRVAQIRVKESLNSWLSRYSESSEQISKVKELHYNAPNIYKEIHEFKIQDDDIIFDNCWTFVRGVKC